MAIVTSQQIKEYYESYKDVEVTFTKEVNDSLRVVRNQISLKYRGGQRPCILYSTSMTGAKIIVALNAGLKSFLEEDNLVSLRFCFLKGDRSDILSFFVQSRLSDLTQYDKDKNLNFAQLTFTQRPPDDLIEILGSLLEANINAARRREERILLTVESMRRLGLSNKGAVIIIDKIPRKGIIRDISFSGMKIIVVGNPKFLMNKDAVVSLSLLTGKKLVVQGRIIRFEAVEDRKDLAALVVELNAEKVPYEYKMSINDYLKHAGRVSKGRGGEH